MKVAQRRKPPRRPLRAGSSGVKVTATVSPGRMSKALSLKCPAISASIITRKRGPLAVSDQPDRSRRRARRAASSPAGSSRAPCRCSGEIMPLRPAHAVGAPASRGTGSCPQRSGRARSWPSVDGRIRLADRLRTTSVACARPSSLDDANRASTVTSALRSLTATIADAADLLSGTMNDRDRRKKRRAI